MTRLTRPWTAVRDLVGSTPGSRQVMAEVDDAGLARLRFSPGDQPSGPVTANYQVGQGAAGNVPAEAINAVVALTTAAATTVAVVQACGNPAPGDGRHRSGEHQRRQGGPARRLPGQTSRALWSQPTTPRSAEQVAGVRSAATVLRWNGGRYAADVAVQPAAGEDPSQELLAAVYDVLWPLRRIGHELWVRPPRYRPLMIALNVDVGADVVRAACDGCAGRAARLRPAGRRHPGLFSPQRMGFGQPVYASPIIAAARASRESRP